MVEHTVFSTLHAKAIQILDTRDVFFKVIQLVELLKLSNCQLLDIDGSNLLLLRVLRCYLHHVGYLLVWVVDLNVLFADVWLVLSDWVWEIVGEHWHGRLV